jgi:hypothetical protein
MDYWLTSFFYNKDYEYLSIVPMKVLVGSIKPGVFEMFNFFIFCSNQEMYVERKVVSLLDILSLAGGFANVLIILAKYISKSFSINAFQWDLAKQIFMIEDGTVKDIDDVET